MTSSRLYSLITKYWPRIAAGSVVVIGLVELVVGGLTADSALEFYLLAWAGTTGGLWFLFEKAESALSEEARNSVAEWLTGPRGKERASSLGDHFVDMFDRVFGDRHWSRRCLNRSAAASLFSVSVLAALFAVTKTQAVTSDLPPSLAPLGQGATVALVVSVFLGLAVIFNVVPDFVSLLETRWAIGRVQKFGSLGRVLVVDLFATAAISAVGLFVMPLIIFIPQEVLWAWGSGEPPVLADALSKSADFVGALVGTLPNPPQMRLHIPFVRISFLSAFFTSVWLWLYAASVFVSRVLLRLNSGVGHLLRVTDVENQPFRSIGFVSVIIVSVLFAAGLPVVLL